MTKFPSSRAPFLFLFFLFPSFARFRRAVSASARWDSLMPLSAAAAPARLRPVPALIWGAGGLVPGAGTLPDELLRRAGFSNSSAAYGLAQWDILPLEYLVARPPRVLLSTGLADVGGERLARHRAVRRLGARITLAPFAARLMNCGGPSIIAAMARLRAIRQNVGRQGVGA